MIRQWLKDQYILYRDYSSLARTTNKKYIPASLEDAKRVQLFNFYLSVKRKLDKNAGLGLARQRMHRRKLFNSIILLQTIRELQKATIKSR